MSVVGSLELRVLAALAVRPAGPAELARVVGAPREEVWRSIRRLVRAGLVVRVDRSLYSVRCPGVVAAASLDERLLKVLAAAADGWITVKEAARVLGVSRRRALEYLRRLVGLGLLRRVARGVYIVSCVPRARSGG